jgi:hypothetical protein
MFVDMFANMETDNREVYRYMCTFKDTIKSFFNTANFQSE